MCVCVSEAISALGHVDASGGGELNSFGTAFLRAGLEWTIELCNADSDGDGESNGLELGDPCCLFRVRECVLFIGTQFSILYTSMYSRAGAASPCAWCL
jgi:hypothetical protein